MSKECTNCHKMGRIHSGYTQEEAAPLLGCVRRTLSGYETGKKKVPDDMTIRMAELYKDPTLPLRHIKYHTPYGDYLPGIPRLQSKEDFVLQVVMSGADIDKAEAIVKTVFADGLIKDHERGDLEQCKRMLQKASGRLLMASMYADTILKNDEILH